MPDNSVDIIFDNIGLPGTADKAMHAIKAGGVYALLSGGGQGKLSDHPKEGPYVSTIVTDSSSDTDGFLPQSGRGDSKLEIGWCL